MIKAFLSITNQDDEFVLHEYDIDEMNRAPHYYHHKIKRFIRAAETVMKEADFCGIIMFQGVLIDGHHEFYEVEQLNPAIIFNAPDTIGEGLKHFARYHEDHMKRIAEKITLSGG